MVPLGFVSGSLSGSEILSPHRGPEMSITMPIKVRQCPMLLFAAGYLLPNG
jgi:hypothetical protein